METFVNDDRFEVHQLTQSFRFGPRIAELSKAVLKVKGSHADLKGTDSLDTHIRPPGYKIEGERVVLHRTAAGVLRTSLNLYQRQIPFIVVGGLAKYFTKELAWFEKIKKGDTKGVPKNFLATYPTWNAAVNVEEKTKDPELTRVIKIIKLAETLKMGNLYDTINHIDEISLGVTNPTAILSTVHKFKGLEHDNVVLSDDFLEFTKLQKLIGEKLEDEINALYVAVTRAMKNIAGTADAVDVTDMHGLQTNIQSDIERLSTDSKSLKASIELSKTGDYGYCDGCGIEIERLNAYPTADKCVDCKSIEEIKLKQQRCH